MRLTMNRLTCGFLVCVSLAACGSSSSGTSPTGGSGGTGGTAGTGGMGGTAGTGGMGGTGPMADAGASTGGAGGSTGGMDGSMTGPDGGTSTGPDGATAAKPPRKVMKKVSGTFPASMLMITDANGKTRKVSKVKLKNPKTKKTVGLADVHADGSYEIDVGIYGEVHYVFIIEDEVGFAIGQLDHYPSMAHQTEGDLESDFPLDQGGDSGPDAVSDIALGAMSMQIVDGEVIFLSENSPTVFVDTDEDGMSDYVDDDDDNDNIADESDPSDDGDATDDATEDMEDVALEEAEEPLDEGGVVGFDPAADNVVQEETAEDEGVSEDAP
jgi:hypothetical protein